jgi:hypothetical protein
MPTLKTKDGEIRVSVANVARMADRMYRLGGKARRDNYVAKARRRLAGGPGRRSDVATVIAAGG